MGDLSVPPSVLPWLLGRPGVGDGRRCDYSCAGTEFHMEMQFYQELVFSSHGHGACSIGFSQSFRWRFAKEDYLRASVSCTISFS